MIDRQAIEQILAQYAKHGWKLRRVLLSARLREAAPDAIDLFNGVDLKPSDLDAIWFSRTSRPGKTAWELRHLGETPFALVTSVEDDAGQETANTILEDTELRMVGSVRRVDNSSAG